jgi:hypothetical protein
MEKLIEDIIDRFAKRKQNIEDRIMEDKESKNNTLILLSAGQIIALDFCINELWHLIEYNKVSNKNKQA